MIKAIIALIINIIPNFRYLLPFMAKNKPVKNVNGLANQATIDAKKSINVKFSLAESAKESTSKV